MAWMGSTVHGAVQFDCHPWYAANVSESNTSCVPSRQAPVRPLGQLLAGAAEPQALSTSEDDAHVFEDLIIFNIEHYFQKRKYRLKTITFL